MSLLTGISKEQDRLSAEGYKPIVVWMNQRTRQMFNKECEKILGRLCKTIYGMEVREDISLPDGEFRLSTTPETSKEFLL